LPPSGCLCRLCLLNDLHSLQLQRRTSHRRRERELLEDKLVRSDLLQRVVASLDLSLVVGLDPEGDISSVSYQQHR